ncbi:MAG TPA: Crp/Fnr family transcriptional regulator [Crocinitomicaceae bacterium]|nr:Crp/Fnr family transcriptional regulator [Crocinitomicaceae bacterium]
MVDKSHKFVSCETCTVRDCSLFSSFNEDDLRQLDNEKTTSFYKKNQPVFLAETYPRGVFCINQGKVKIFSVGENGKEQIIHIAKEGEVIGFRSLFSDEPYRLSGETLEDCNICFIKKDDFHKHLETKPSLLQSVLKNLSLELGERAVFIKDMAQKTVRERLATVLLVLDNIYGEEMINLSREDMANFVGTATETVIRLLKEFKDDGLIEIHSRKIELLDKRKLLQEAGN